MALDEILTVMCKLKLQLHGHTVVGVKRVKDQRGLYGLINYVPLMPLGRIRDISSRKILDSATRKRRQKRQLDALEKDNFQDDPHSHLTVVPAKMKVPAFNDTMEGNNQDNNVFALWLLHCNSSRSVIKAIQAI